MLNQKWWNLSLRIVEDLQGYQTWFSNVQEVGHQNLKNILPFYQVLLKTFNTNIARDVF